MNLYIRYFAQETLVYTVDEAIKFLRSVPEIQCDATLEREVREYAEGTMNFPRRFKRRAKVYVIMIKTMASTMEDFKNKKALMSSTSRDVSRVADELSMDKTGWYEVKLTFKRMCLLPQSSKYGYSDTDVVYQLIAQSPLDAYTRATEHIKKLVDPRSQLPSVKGKMFRWTYLGKTKNA